MELAGQLAGQPGEHPSRLELARFVDPLPTLKRLAPVYASKQEMRYRVAMVESTHRFHSALPPARVWGYEGSVPGPLIEATRGKRVVVDWQNRLPAHHLIPIDPHIHGAMPPAPEVRTVPHLHGIATSSESDGLPEKWFTPGQSARYSYPNEQQAATLWYHDHAVGITRLNVYAGLSGFYLLRDEPERRLGLPAGDYELPLLIQDRTLNAEGQLVYAPTHDDGVPLPPGVWGPEFIGELPVVNGAVAPYVEVEPRLYRLRLLNGSNTRFFELAFNLAHRVTDIPKIIEFQQIGSDGGFLARPATLSRVLVGPAERADVLVDFSAHEGSTVTLTNGALAPYPGWGMLGMHAPQIHEVMQFRVVRPRKGPAAAFTMGPLPLLERWKESDAAVTREFVLSESIDAKGRSLGVRINGKGYDDPVSEVVKKGTLEKWRFVNTTEDAHPMHVHLVQFQVLYRQGFDPFEFRRGRLKPLGKIREPLANEMGWKDTAVVLPNEVLTILVRFPEITGRFVFHCHMLEHEDNDMMRPFEVVS